jgi:hypothetical protein
LPVGMWHTLASDRGILHALPLLACALAAALRVAAHHETRWHGIFSLLLFLAVLTTSCATRWWAGGATLPGRFLLVVTPVLMACLARALTDAGPAFRALALYLGTYPVVLFVAQLTVLRFFGRRFHVLYFLEQYHPWFERMPRFFYDPYREMSLWPALALYTAAILLVFRPRWPRRWSYAVLGLMAACFAWRVEVPGPAAFEDRMRHMALRASRRPVQRGAWVVMRRSAAAVPLLAYSDVFAPMRAVYFKSLTSRDLGRAVVENWISTPHLEVNDWAGRDYRWATLVRPFRARAGWRVCVVDADVGDGSDVELVIREGGIVHVARRYAAGASTREAFRFEALGRGYVTISARFVDGDGELRVRRIAFTAYDPRLLRCARLTLDLPEERAPAPDPPPAG